MGKGIPMRLLNHCRTGGMSKIVIMRIKIEGRYCLENKLSKNKRKKRIPKIQLKTRNTIFISSILSYRYDSIKEMLLGSCL
jgi:hypothetical protein